ncbi:succinate dehydrogenase assembly factor 4, mitochondrial isoform X4 [Rissa tridactyla]|uniref:succinate dehydrogenase assembly factor 4, mitochondrial isoform X4 n=1 Tax=Rissa tridactyla TaxID=75485 RepID=UPI0023BA550E|nr:succinate dehydrogenase assembly factor 4, mitochondrial isoform X4 [Rissa tridactyla]
MALRLLRGAPGAAKSSLLCSSLRSTSSKTRGRSEPAKQPLKKPKLPVGRFDEPEESSIEREPLERDKSLSQRLAVHAGTLHGSKA